MCLRMYCGGVLTSPRLSEQGDSLFCLDVASVCLICFSPNALGCSDIEMHKKFAAGQSALLVVDFIIKFSWSGLLALRLSVLVAYSSAVEEILCCPAESLMRWLTPLVQVQLGTVLTDRHKQQALLSQRSISTSEAHWLALCVQLWPLASELTASFMCVTVGVFVFVQPRQACTPTAHTLSVRNTNFSACDRTPPSNIFHFPANHDKISTNFPLLWWLEPGEK